MSVSHLLEDFGTLARGTPVALTDISLEEQKLDAFEKGYQAGWDDSIKAQHDDATHLSVDFAQNIKDLSFTYQEAFNGMLSAQEPLIRQLVDAVLPQVASDSLGAQLTEIIQDFVRDHGKHPVHIVVAPGSVAALQAVLPSDDAIPLEISEDATLAEGQAHLSFGQVGEREIDLQGLLTQISQAVDAFFHNRTDQHKETA